MTCLRCDGLMVHEKFEDLDGLWSSDHEFTGWRCLNCGAIVDPVIAAHKRITSPPLARVDRYTAVRVHASPRREGRRGADHRTTERM